MTPWAVSRVRVRPACRYNLRVLFEAIDMRWDWPVDANYHEAKAYCAWRAEQDGSPIMCVLCGLLLRSSLKPRQ